MSMKEFCIETILLLNKCSMDDWAKVFVERRMQFQRDYGNGLVLSTSHGIDFFENVLACLDGAPWDEKGHLGDAFRKLTGAKKSEPIQPPSPPTPAQEA